MKKFYFQVIKSEGELVDVQQKIEELCKYEKVLGRKNAFLNLLVETIPTAEIHIRFNRENQCITMQPNAVNVNEVRIDIQKDEARVALNGGSDQQKNAMTEKNLPMDRKIIKEFRYLLERKTQSESERKKEDSLKKQILFLTEGMEVLNAKVGKVDSIEQSINEIRELLKQKLS